MIRFQDGPAVGCRGLCLARAPLFLRVVRAPDGTVDALDQPGDAPRPDEQVWAYVRVGPAGSCHVRFARGKGVSGFYASAAYRLCDVQPDDATIRDSARWQAWATAQAQPKGPRHSDD